MDRPHAAAGVRGIRWIGALLTVAAPLSGTALAGGHHGQTVYVPVQAAAPAYQVAAAPTYQVAAAPTYQVAAAPAYQVAAAPTYSVAAAPAYVLATSKHKLRGAAAYPVAAAPVYQVAAAPTYQVAAAPTYQVAAAPTYQVAAAPTYQVAAAPTYQVVTVQAAPPSARPRAVQAAPKAAAAPAARAGQLYYYYPGAANVAASPGVAAAPNSGRLNETQRDEIAGKLKDYAASLGTAGLGADDIRAAVTSRAQEMYTEYTNVDYTAFSDDDNDAVKGLVDSALGDASDAQDDSSASSSGSAAQSAAQVMTVPAVVAAPAQLFLPVRVKQHHLHPFN